MSDAVVLTCPRCGAGIERGWNAMQAQCRYCGTVVDLPQVAPPVVPAPAPYSPVPYRTSTKPSYAGLVFGLSMVALVVGITAGVGFWQNMSGPQQTSVVGAAARLNLLQGQEAVPITAADLKTLDPASEIQQAAAAVRQRDSQCELTYAYIGMIGGAGLDATGVNSLMNFSCHAVDKTKPPGQDVSDNEWAVRVFHGYFTLEKSKYGSHNKPPWQEPTCPFSQAWAAAVASGLPSNAVATVYYRETGWSLTVDGHPEYERTVSGTTCRVVHEK